jgi:hypothetical protein
MLVSERLEQIRNNFNEKLETQRIKLAENFFNRIDIKEFDRDKEISELQLQKAACDIAQTIFDDLFNREVKNL